MLEDGEPGLLAADHGPAGMSRRCFSLAAAGIMIGRSALAAGAPTRPAGDFVDSVGVCVHLGAASDNTAFAQFRDLIGASGIRTLREDMRRSNNPDRWRDLYATHGIRCHLLVSPVKSTVPEFLDFIRKVGPESIAAVEGQNEGDTNWFMSQPAAHSDWSATVVAYQREVFQAVRQHYPSLPVVSPTLLDWKPKDTALIQEAADYCDIVALHAYAQKAQEPETRDDYAALDWYFRNYRDKLKPGAPVMVTETGYFNITAPRGHGISELAASIYLPRLLLNNFAAGVLRTFLYEFLDGGTNPSDAEHHYGLIRFDGTPKPAFHTVAALVKALHGHPQEAARAGDRPIRIAFPDAPADLRKQVFSHHGGGLTLALWRPLRVWDVERGQDVTSDPRPVTILAEGRFARMTSMPLDGNAGWTSITVAEGRATISVGGCVTLVRVDAVDA